MASNENNESSFGRQTMPNQGNIGNARQTMPNQGNIGNGRQTMPNQGNVGNARQTMPNQGNIGNARQTMPNQGNVGNGRQTMPNQGNVGNARQTMPNQGNVGNARQTMPNQGNNSIKPLSRAPMDPIDVAPRSVEAVSLTGQVIAGYTIGESMNQKSGEAELYRCTDSDGGAFVLKYFLRELSEKEIERHAEITRQLNEIGNGVVRIQATGLYNGYLYEIMPFYSAGSLRDRMKQRLFSETEIKEDILPRMLEILKSIHDKGIYHSDIKPENILYRTKGEKDLVLIDFGVSKITEGGTVTMLTKTVGGTSDYQAPEATKGVLLPETDYYALGITLFELQSGNTPRGDIQSRQEIEQRTILETIPWRDGMSEDMYRLLYYLTYDSIRNRKDRHSLQNRWIYADVKQWLIDGNPRYPLPRLDDSDPEVNIRFNGRLYERLTDLIIAMASDWERGCNFVVRPAGGLMEEMSKSASRNRSLLPLADEIKSFIGAAKQSGVSDDAVLFEFIYQYGREIQPIFWKGFAYETLNKLGEAILRSLSHSAPKESLFYELLTENLLELYATNNLQISEQDQEKLRALKRISYEGDVEYALYEAAYVLMNKKYYFLEEDRRIKTPEGLKLYLANEGAKGNLKGMIELCHAFVGEKGEDKPVLRAWLDACRALGKQESDPHKEVKALKSIDRPTKTDIRMIETDPLAESKKKTGALGVILGLLILAMFALPAAFAISAIAAGRMHAFGEVQRRCFLICVVGLPVLPLLLARLLCIPRNRTTNLLFKTVSGGCRILKYDVILVIAALILGNGSMNGMLNRAIGFIRSGYYWTLNYGRIVIGLQGGNGILDSLAEKLGIGQIWFSDVARLICVFIVYAVAAAILRRRREA